MTEDPKNTPEFSALMGVLLGLGGIIGTIAWILNSSEISWALAALLAIASVVIFLWSLITVFALIKAGRSDP